jgi:ubiquinone biosynthesis protein UbiJ
MLSSTQLIVLQGLINQAIRIDSSAEKRLHALDGKTLRLQCNEPAMDICITIEQAQICLEPGSQRDKVSTHIQGELGAYLNLLSAEDKTSALINSNLRLSGDSQLLVDLQQALMHLELDWEYHLAQLVGDIPAHHLGQLSRKGLNFLKNSQPIFKRHLQEFILEEAKLAVTIDEFDHFVKSIQHTEQQLERIGARLSQARERLSQKD